MMRLARAAAARRLLVRHTASHAPRNDALREAAVLQALRSVVDPTLGGRDIVSLGAIKNLHVRPDAGSVSLAVEVLPGRKFAAQVADDAARAVRTLDWVKDAAVSTLPPATMPMHASIMKAGLERVGNVIAVSRLKQLGARVGLFDADVYGPSLPTMISPADSTVRQTGQTSIEPVVFEGVPTMSYGFAARKADGSSGAALMRGPMVTNVIRQLLTFTQWGALDYLVVDMPPGTGDVQLTLAQSLGITAAVIVTTPQRLSFVDVVKGIHLFNTMKVPTAALVENMALFVCRHGEEHRPFGPGHADEIMRQFGIPHLTRLPIDADLCASGDQGRPLVLQQPDSPVAGAYRELAHALADEVARQRMAGGVPPSVTFAPNRGLVLRLFGRDAAEEFAVPAARVRKACKCAACVDEMTGRKLLDDAAVPASIEPTKIVRQGNYAVAVTWSDGHDSSIYTFEQLRALSAVAAAEAEARA